MSDSVRFNVLEGIGKRKRNEKEWKANKRKRSRAEGKPYINRMEKLIPARKTGNECRYA